LSFAAGWWPYFDVIISWADGTGIELPVIAQSRLSERRSNPSGHHH
jgi:hypothetical protein